MVTFINTHELNTHETQRQSSPLIYPNCWPNWGLIYKSWEKEKLYLATEHQLIIHVAAIKKLENEHLAAITVIIMSEESHEWRLKLVDENMIRNRVFP